MAIDRKRTLELILDHMAFLKMKHGPFRMEIDQDLLLVLFSNLELALLHPQNNGHSAIVLRAFLDDMVATLDRASPGLGDLLRAVRRHPSNLN